jgi:hypothetical protein
MVKRAQLANLSSPGKADRVDCRSFDQSPFWRSAAVRVDGGNLPADGRWELFTAGDRFEPGANGSKLRATLEPFTRMRRSRVLENGNNHHRNVRANAPQSVPER